MFKVSLHMPKLNPLYEREVYVHTAFLVSLLMLVTLLRGALRPYIWQLWVGGAVGVFLPLLDHLIYIFVLRPDELTSQRVKSKLFQKQFSDAAAILAETRSERSKQIIHTVLFQVIFMVLTFLVVTSSGSFFGTGLVLAFSLHLLVDEVMDFTATGTISGWLRELAAYLPEGLTRDQTKLYLGVTGAALLFFGVFL